MNDHLACFRARINLHLRSGWTVVDTLPNRLDITLRKQAIGSPRAIGDTVTSQAAATRSAFRRIYVDRDGKVQVRRVGGPPTF